MKRIIIPTLLSSLLAMLGCQRASSSIAPTESRDNSSMHVVVIDDTVSMSDVSEPQEPPAPAKSETDTPAAFAGDFGSQLIARVLAPSEPPIERERRAAPLSRAGAIAIERPEAPTAAPPTQFISFPAPRRASLKPRSLPTTTPLADFAYDPPLPERIELPPTFLVSTPSRDVNLPPELPVQARHQLDRASLEDPTAEFSLELAQRAKPPLRDKPAPFVKVNLPEPFEHRAAIREAPSGTSVVAPTPGGK